MAIVAKRQSANMVAMQQIVKWSGLVFIALGVLYSDVMFISMMLDAFPSGILRIAAIAGAMLTSVSIVFLLLGKSYVFRPGLQYIWAWFFTGIEVLVAVLNIIVSFLRAT